MLGTGPAQVAAAALLFGSGLACGRTGLAAWPANDAASGAPHPGPDAKSGADTAAKPDDWLARCRDNLAHAGLGVNGQVYSLALGDDDTVYLGGNFSWAGPLTGGGVPFVLPEGQPAPAFARVSGTVFAVAPDGAGGWFIGGWFDRVGGLPRKNLAHLGADGDVDAGFQADTDDKVSAIAVMGKQVYVGGQFATLGGLPRSRLGMVDFKGAVAAWSPSIASTSSNGYPKASIRTLLALNGRLYVGGEFTTLAGADRAHLAVFEADGTLGAWHPTVSRGIDHYGETPVRALASDGNTLWVGGDFDLVSGIPHRAIAAFDLSGNLRPWDAQLDEFDVVAALAAGPGVLYVGGEISSSRSAGKRQSHSGLAAFDDSGAPLDWNPSLTTSRYDEEPVMALALAGDTLFVGGIFDTIAGLPRAGLAALDRQGKALDWNPSADGPIYAMASQGNAVFAGGEVTTLCGWQRNSLAAIAGDGRLLDWNPDVRGYIQSVVLHGDTLLAGGGFTFVGEQERWLLAEIRLSDGRATAFAPTFENGGWISSIQPFGDAIYIGGGFTAVNGKPVGNVAALASDGSLLPWPSVASWGTGGPFAVLGDLLYVGGATDYGGAGRGKLAAFAEDRSPRGPVVEADRGIGPLLADARRGLLHTGGSFSEIAGARRAGLAAFDPSLSLLAWNPSLGMAPRWISAMAMLGEELLVAGVFETTQGELRSDLLALDSEGKPKPFRPNLNADVRCLQARDGTVYVGGGFSFIDGHFAGGFAKLRP